MIEQVAWNKSSLLLKTQLQKKHKHYNYLQRILKQKVFTKVIKNAKFEGLGAETYRSYQKKGVVLKIYGEVVEFP